MAALEELLELDELAKLLELDDAGEELLELLTELLELEVLLTELAELTADELLKELIALLELATGIIKALLDELEELTEAMELLELEELTEAKELLELTSAPFSTLLELAAELVELAELELEELAWSGLLFINSSMPALSLSLHAVRAAARQPMAARREQMVNDPLIGIDIPFVESCMRVRT